MSAAEAENYTIYEILTVTEGTLAPVACLDPDADICPREKSCKTLPMWKKFNSTVRSFFEDITLEDLMNGNL